MGLHVSSAHGLPAFIDVEASGLGRGSYPIEIGVCLPDGTSRCWLIRPAPLWRAWEPAAERIHRLSRDLLERHGRPIRSVAEELNEVLAGQVVYSDAWGNDMPWVAALFDEAGLVQRFRIEALRAIVPEVRLAEWNPMRKRIELELSLRRHRASADALALQQTWAALCLPP
ncbi:MAG: hypothetical protein R3E33_05345 [Rhodocyclaceae bacterium]